MKYLYYLQFCLSFLVILLNAEESELLNSDERLLKVGCYAKEDISGFSTVRTVTSASECIQECHNIYKRFAGIYNGDSCMCGEYYSGFDLSNCDIPCENNKNETCGGSSSASVYETAGGALGAPKNLSLIKSLENSLQVSWKPPASSLSDIKNFKVVAKPIFYFSEHDHPIEKHYIFSHLTQTAFLDGLHPGTSYLVTVKASSVKGDGYPASIEGWTKVGKPETPMVPQLISRTPTTMIVQLEQVMPSGGPISSYHVIVVDESLPVIIDFDSLSDYNTALEQGLPYYIAAEFPPSNFETVFTVGDGKFYGKYFNSPLKANSDYHVLLGVISTINETKSSYSTSTHTQHESSHIDFGHSENLHPAHDSEHEETNSENPNYTLVLSLSVAIGLIGFLLLTSVVIYFVLRVYFKKNTRLTGDHQELAIHAHIPNQDYENGYAVGAHYVDDEELSPDHYRLLREKVNIFPHQSINIIGDIGVGKFGAIKKGISLLSGSEQMNVLIHRIQDDALNPTEKAEMLRNFDMHIKIGKHQNIVSLLGLLEELNIISVVFEYETLTLKSHLIESRAVQHYPVYAEKNRRFSTLQETQLLEILVGIARGMNHMSSLSIPHGQITARNIALRDGMHPKLTGFGLIHYNNDIYIPDYCRWHSPEALRLKISTCSSDIWSFGCLMWEVVTLGGTPYADVRTEEIPTRIVRGLRLPQLQYVSDELYQSMLLCWQNDPEERPSFGELESLLHRLSTDDITPHLLFSLYPSFKYEPLCPHLEFIE